MTINPVASVADSTIEWVLTHPDGRRCLRVPHGTAVLAVPTAVGRRVVGLLHSFGSGGPVLGVRGPRPLWLLLCDADETVVAAADLPAGARLYSFPADVPLNQEAPVQVAWVVPPAGRRPWSPTVATVVSALRTAVAARR